MAEKRATKAAEEAKEAKANELIRRKAGQVRTVNLFPFFHANTVRARALSIAQEAVGIKEDMKNKQILKDLEAKRRGSSSHHPLPHPSHQVATRSYIQPFQKRRTTSGPAPPSRPRSKPTSASARKKRRRKRRSVRVLPPLRCPLHRQGRLLLRPPPAQPQRRLRSPVVSSRRRGCRSGSRAVGSR